MLIPYLISGCTLFGDLDAFRLTGLPLGILEH